MAGVVFLVRVPQAPRIKPSSVRKVTEGRPRYRRPESSRCVFDSALRLFILMPSSCLGASRRYLIGTQQMSDLPRITGGVSRSYAGSIGGSALG